MKFMPEDNTMQFQKTDAGPQQSKIFNTSVRGWIALIGMVTLSVLVLLIVLAPYRGVEVPTTTSSTLIGLFVSSVTAAIIQYFPQGSKEGQK